MQDGQKHEMRSANNVPVWAVVPVKSLTRAKTRLAGVLAPSARRRLVLTMFEDVLAILRATPAIGSILVVTADRLVALNGEREGARIIPEGHPAGLNGALRLGALHARRGGAKRVLFIPADVPLATPAEIGQLVSVPYRSEGEFAVIVPAQASDGTNALLLSPPEALAPNFGQDSFAMHCRQAASRGLQAQVMRLKGLGKDIDEPADLAALMMVMRGSVRYAFLPAALRDRASRLKAPARMRAAPERVTGVSEP